MIRREPIQVPEHHELAVAADGTVPLPPSIQEALGLGPGDLLSLTRNQISIRLDLYGELLEDLWLSVKPPNRWRCLEQFLRRTLVSVADDGSIAIPPELMTLHAGDRLVLEVLSQGLSHILYVYRADA